MSGLGFKTFTAGDVLTAADVNGYLMSQAVMVFDDAAARTTALPTPAEGMVTYLKDTDSFWSYDGSNWVEVAKQIGTTFTSYTPTLSGSGWTFGSPTVSGFYTQIGKLVTVAFRIAWAGGVTTGAGRIEISLPVAAISRVVTTSWGGVGYRDDTSLGTLWPHIVQPYTTTTMALYAISHSADANTSSLAAINNAAGLVVPVDNGDNWYGSCVYEAA
jgi:hypothetical protein